MSNKLTFDTILEKYDELQSQQKAADALGISRRQVRKALNWRSNVPDLDGYETVQVRTEDGVVVGSKHKPTSEEPDTNKDIHDLKNAYSVSKITTHYGEGGHREGRIQDEYVMYSPEKEAEWQYFEGLKNTFTGDNIVAFRDKALVEIGRKPPHQKELESQYLTVYISTDEHFNLRAHADAVGEDWNLQKAVDAHKYNFERLLARTSRAIPSEGVLHLHLGDKFHANDHMNVTPRGKNSLDTDLTMEAAAEAVIELELWKSEYLLDIYDWVDNRGVKGNHDKDPMFWTFKGLELAYRNNPNIGWDYHTKGYGCEVWGENAIMFDHGYTMKPEELAQTLGKVFSDKLGATKYWDLHTGHVHHDQVRDMRNGITFNSHRASCGHTVYEHDRGYDSKKSLRSIVYHNQEGKVAQFDQNF